MVALGLLTVGATAGAIDKGAGGGVVLARGRAGGSKADSESLEITDMHCSLKKITAQVSHPDR